MNLHVGIPLFFAAAALQSTVLPYLRIFGGQPDLIVVIVLAWAILDHDREGLVWAFLGGLFLDLLSGVPLGVSSLALVPIAYLIGLTETRVYRDNTLLLLLLTGVGAFAYHLIYMIAIRFIGGFSLGWAAGITYVTLPSVLFDVSLIIPALWILSRWYDKLHPRQIKF